MMRRPHLRSLLVLQLSMMGVIALAHLSCGAGRARPEPRVVPPPSPGDVDVTLYLIGDAGNPAPGFEPVLAALGADLDATTSERIVVFLGDNIYPRGLPRPTDPTRRESERRLDAQLAVLRATGTHGVFVPGNHDWDAWGDSGWDAIRRQGEYISAHGAGLATMRPRNGCPGPDVVDVGQTVRLVLLDTQWWLHRGPKPTHPSSSCPADSKAEVTQMLREVLRDAGTRRTIVLGHHPLRTAGPHGGYFDWDAHIFPLRAFKKWLWVPLPVVGSLYPLARNLGISSQDLSGPRNRELRDSLRSAFLDRPPLIYAGGHEHALQVVRGEREAYALVSGSGIFGHTSPVGCPPDWLWCEDVAGYMRVDVPRDGGTRLGVITVGITGGGAEVFSMVLDPRSATRDRRRVPPRPQ